MILYFLILQIGDSLEKKEQKIVDDLAQVRWSDCSSGFDGFSNFSNFRNKVIAPNDPAI